MHPLDIIRPLYPRCNGESDKGNYGYLHLLGVVCLDGRHLIHTRNVSNHCRVGAQNISRNVVCNTLSKVAKLDIPLQIGDSYFVTTEKVVPMLFNLLCELIHVHGHRLLAELFTDFLDLCIFLLRRPCITLRVAILLRAHSHVQAWLPSANKVAEHPHDKIHLICSKRLRRIQRPIAHTSSPLHLGLALIQLYSINFKHRELSVLHCGLHGLPFRKLNALVLKVQSTDCQS
mmetsp:Transcript_18907/g.36074  ORF Transcript_18907/g.36074 Transcript_18907/m.36074 type:complete len:231 (-) Transcript_18907:253-945(-)